MAKKLKLDPGFSSDFTIIGISCHLKDYKMAFNVNSKLGLNLKRGTDFASPTPEGRDCTYSFYHSGHESGKCNYFLLSNHHPESKLLPYLKTTDYFFIIDEVLGPSSIQALITPIRQIQNVLTAFEVKQDTVKNIDTFLSDLELHITETLQG